VGAKAGQRGKAERDRSAGRQRLALIVFGALLVLLFVGFAVAQGIGAPSVPSGDVALVQSVPDEYGQVSQEQFDDAIKRQVKEGKLKKTPEPGSDKYEELKEGALRELLEPIWIRGEAESLGVKVTDKQVEDELAQIKKQSFPTKASYDKFLEESGFSQEEVLERVELQVLSSALQEQVNSEAPAPTSDEIEAYYEAEKESQFTEKESRDVRFVVNKDKAEVEAAKKELEKDSSSKNWEAVAKKYSSDPTTKTKGGLQKAVTEEFLQGPLKKAIFGSATGELAGPAQLSGNYFVVEVVKLNPAKVKSLGEVKAQIEETLKGEKQQEFFAEFVSDYQSRWTARTFCADGYVIEQCSNFKGDGRPANASPACYEADPKTPAKECPAIVTPISPALPGSVTEQKPKGEPFPQRPLPEASEEQGKEVPTPVPGGAAPPQGE
jgi:foldase protein PrsA